jgi:putative lipoprotein
MRTTAILAGAVAACLGGAAMAETITGSVTYRERIAVPPGAVIEVQLLDVSRADAAATQLSAQRFALQAVPFDFTLAYDPALIDERMTYSVSASVTVDDRLVWRTAQHNPVLTRGAGDEVEMLLTRIAAGGDTPPLEGTEWTIVEMQGVAFQSDPPSSLTFGDGGRLAAYAGCNRFSGQVEIDGDALRVGDNMAGTMMACPEPVQIGEQAMLQTLVDVARYAVEDDMLVLYDLDDRPVMRLAPVPGGG